MICETYPLNTLGQYKYVVTLSFHRGKILLSRHKDRITWETQGGHIEEGETPLEAAKRELMEESGATEFNITPLFDYRCPSRGGGWSNGMVFLADIDMLGPLPDSEMAETRLFDALPDNITYPQITPKLLQRALEEEIHGIYPSQDHRLGPV